MAVMIDVAKEFNYKITAFHHGVEAYKIADLLADNGICGALWADWWRLLNTKPMTWYKQYCNC